MSTKKRKWRNKKCWQVLAKSLTPPKRTVLHRNNHHHSRIHNPLERKTPVAHGFWSRDFWQLQCVSNRIPKMDGNFTAGNQRDVLVSKTHLWQMEPLATTSLIKEVYKHPQTWELVWKSVSPFLGCLLPVQLSLHTYLTFVVSSAGTSCHDTVDSSKILRTKFWLIGDSWSHQKSENPTDRFPKDPDFVRAVRSLFVFHRKSPTWKNKLSLVNLQRTRETFTLKLPEFCQRRLGLHQRYPARREYDRSSRYNLAGSVALIPKDMF